MVTAEERAEMEAELAEMRRQYDLLAEAPRKPVGDDWRGRRDEKRDVFGRHIERVEAALDQR